MKAEDIFSASVEVMKGILGREEMTRSLARSKERSEDENSQLLRKERENINGLVRRIAEAGGQGGHLDDAGDDLKDALVLRYLINREIFVKTFPGGIDGIDADPVSIWAAMMISPRDD